MNFNLPGVSFPAGWVLEPMSMRLLRSIGPGVWDRWGFGGEVWEGVIKICLESRGVILDQSSKTFGSFYNAL